LLERINVGGMAEVFRAKAYGVEGFERLVAVKRILPNIAADNEFVRMFVDEAKIAVQLNHANIAQVFDLGVVDGHYYIALEHVHGRDLRGVFDRCRALGQAMPVPIACYTIMRLCEGLDYAHNKRDQSGEPLDLVHRDVSPQNVLVSFEGEVKIIDFGVAKTTSKRSQTQAGILKGKFGYMSPEQVRGLPIDRRSDVFATGIVLYELLTGQRLFLGESDFSTLEKVRNVEILPPRTFNSRIPPELERIVLRALARETNARYQSAIELHDDLQAFVYGAGMACARRDLAAWMKQLFAQELAVEQAKLDAFRRLVPPAELVLQRHPTAAAGAGPGRTGSAPPRTAPAQIVDWEEEELLTTVYGGDEEELLAPADARQQPAQARRTVSGVPGQPPAAGLNSSHGGGSGGTESVLSFEPPAPAVPGWSSSRAEAIAIPREPVLPKSMATGSNQMRSPFRSGRPDPTMDVHEGDLRHGEVRDGYLRDGYSRDEHGHGGSVPGPVGAPGYYPGPGSAPGPGMLPPHPPPAGSPPMGQPAVYPRLGSPGVMPQYHPHAAVGAGRPRLVTYVLLIAIASLLLGTAVVAALFIGGQDGDLFGADLFDADREQLVVAAGEALDSDVLDRTGFDIVVEPKGVNVKLDGKLWGRAPLKFRNLTPGKHLLEIEAPPGFFNKTETIEVEAGKAQLLSFHLDPMDVIGSFVSEPAGAQVTLVSGPRRRSLGVAPTTAKLDPRRRYEVVFEMDGYTTVTRPVEITGSEVTVSATLVEVLRTSDPGRDRPVGEGRRRPRRAEIGAEEPRGPRAEAPARAAATGTLGISAKPPCRILIDGRDTGMTTPQRDIELPAGRHRVTLVNEDFGIRKSFPVLIEPDEATLVKRDWSAQIR
jgi:hypothetical protein